ncbi:MAG: hypothetical protein M3Z30_01255 [Gemmatimonadota bacterium]|nr:hypothetical protein [Gemmatimonadota bacterium]
MKTTITCIALLLSTGTAAAQSRNLPPASDRALARDIYKEMIETKPGFTAGATEPAAIRFRGRDERLGVRSFYEGDQFLYELLKRLSS